MAYKYTDILANSRVSNLSKQKFGHGVIIDFNRRQVNGSFILINLILIFFIVHSALVQIYLVTFGAGIISIVINYHYYYHYWRTNSFLELNEELMIVNNKHVYKWTDIEKVQYKWDDSDDLVENLVITKEGADECEFKIPSYLNTTKTEMCEAIAYFFQNRGAEDDKNN